MSKIKNSIIIGLLFLTTYFLLIVINIPFFDSRFLYETFDLNEWFGSPLVSYLLWGILWAIIGAFGWYGYTSGKKVLLYTVVILFFVMHVFTYLFEALLWHFACLNGCYFW